MDYAKGAMRRRDLRRSRYSCPWERGGSRGRGRGRLKDQPQVSVSIVKASFPGLGRMGRGWWGDVYHAGAQNCLELKSVIWARGESLAEKVVKPAV